MTDYRLPVEVAGTKPPIRWSTDYRVLPTSIRRFEFPLVQSQVPATGQLWPRS